MENEDVIRKQMENTRTSLTEKLETLETKVADTVEEATTAVSDTVENIKESVEETVATVKDSVEGTVSAVKDTVQDGVETVKHWCDVPAHVDAHPWLMMGGSVALGYFLEVMTRPRSPSRMVGSLKASHGAAPMLIAGAGVQEPRPTERPAPSKSWLSAFVPEINKLKQLALSALLSSVRDTVVRSVPPNVSEQLQGVFDSVTTKLGGEPLAKSADSGRRPFEPATENGGRHPSESYRYSP
jgi:ElaB/YqjD/DUF883 family membrane-anchored ribosome-binding protein